MITPLYKPRIAVSLTTEAHKEEEAGLTRMCESIRHAVAAANLHVKDIAAIGVATPGLMDIPGGRKSVTRSSAATPVSSALRLRPAAYPCGSVFLPGVGEGRLTPRAVIF